jgi:hypothetical protein
MDPQCWTRTRESLMSATRGAEPKVLDTDEAEPVVIVL